MISEKKFQYIIKKLLSNLFFVDRLKILIKPWVIDIVNGTLNNQFEGAVKKYIEKNYKVCDVSGALIEKGVAIAGKSEIRSEIREEHNYIVDGWFKIHGEEKIYTPHYSPAFAPKNKKAKKKK